MARRCDTDFQKPLYLIVYNEMMELTLLRTCNGEIVRKVVLPVHSYKVNDNNGFRLKVYIYIEDFGSLSMY